MSNVQKIGQLRQLNLQVLIKIRICSYLSTLPGKPVCLAIHRGLQLHSRPLALYSIVREYASKFVSLLRRFS